MIIYLLSILEGVSFVACIAGTVCLFAALFTFIRNEFDALGSKPLLPVKPFLVGASVSFLFAGLVPSTDSLIKAYVIVEGSKIVTADNAEAATKELLKRVDAVLEIAKGDDK